MPGRNAIGRRRIGPSGAIPFRKTTPRQTRRGPRRLAVVARVTDNGEGGAVGGHADLLAALPPEGSFLEGNPRRRAMGRNSGPVPQELIEHIAALPAPVRVGVTGRVAVGKSTFARELASALAAAGRTGVVLGTDGFLFPTHILEARGLMRRKGRFETHDVPALLDAMTSWSAGTQVRVPVYDHLAYDRLPDPVPLPPGDVLVVEGLLAAHPEVADRLHHRIFLDATDPDHVRGWYLERCLANFPVPVDRFEAAWVDINERTYADETRAAAEHAHAVLTFDGDHHLCHRMHRSMENA